MALLSDRVIKSLRRTRFRRLESDGALPAKVHVWWQGPKGRCFCGALDWDEPRLEDVKPGEGGVLCKRCAWYPDHTRQYLKEGHHMFLCSPGEGALWQYTKHR